MTEKFYRYIAATDTPLGDGVRASDALANAISDQINGVSGQLVTIDSEYENQRVHGLAQDNNVWLGGSDKTEEGEWHWLNGTEEGEQFWSGGINGSQTISGDFVNFDPAEPDNATAAGADGEDYLALNGSGEWWDWSDRSNHRQGYIIEWDAADLIQQQPEFTFSLTDTNGPFSIDPITGEVTVADTTQINFDDATSHDIEVQVTDINGDTFTEVLTVDVCDAPPLVLELPDSSVDENSADGTVVGTVTVDLSLIHI